MERTYEFRNGVNTSVDFSVVENAKAFIVSDIDTNETLCSFISFNDTKVLEILNTPVYYDTLEFYRKSIVNIDAHRNKVDNDFYDCNYVAIECESNQQMLEICQDVFDVLTNVKISVLE